MRKLHRPFEKTRIWTGVVGLIVVCIELSLDLGAVAVRGVVKVVRVMTASMDIEVMNAHAGVNLVL